MYGIAFTAPFGTVSVLDDGEKIIKIALNETFDCIPSSLSSECQTQLNEYFSGTRKNFSLPLSVAGSPFFCDVIQSLAAVPYGQTVSYSELAALSGHPTAVRAVASCCHKNPFPIVVPCHRVLGKRSLGGYAYGSDLKLFLLRTEQYFLSRQGFSPTEPF